jgi:glycosyltransferase involved in cell wall biosynthesis
MPRISVLIPTHDHAATLPYALRSVQAQGIDDLEILICGDGVTDEVRAAVCSLQQSEPRIRFFDLPKAPGIGELNRDIVLQQASGRIVCMHNDDDLWLPGHIAAFDAALDEADFVGAMQVNVGTDDKVRAHYFDLERPEFVEPWLDWTANEFGSWACNGFGPIFVAYRLAAYLRLPERYTTTPVGLPPDQTMWHKFLRQPWCRAKFLRWPVALYFSSVDRRSWTAEQRADELRRWTEIIETQDWAARLLRDVLPDLGDRLLRQALDERRHDLRDQHAAALRRLEARRMAEHNAFSTRIGELETTLSVHRAAAAAQAVELQKASSAERGGLVARIEELGATISDHRAAAAAQAMELQTTFAAERGALVARIEELDAIISDHRAAAAAQVVELQAAFAAERNALIARVEELEARLADGARSPLVRIREMAAVLRRRNE